MMAPRRPHPAPAQTKAYKTMAKIKPMAAMSLNWHLNRSLNQGDFLRVSDKVRDQLIENGMGQRDATLKAPVMLEGLISGHNGDLDFARIHYELKAENKGFALVTA